MMKPKTITKETAGKTADGLPSYPFGKSMPFQQRLTLTYMSRCHPFSITINGAKTRFTPDNERENIPPVVIHFGSDHRYILDGKDELYVQKRNKLEDPSHFRLLASGGTMIFPDPSDHTWVEAGYFKETKGKSGMIPVEQTLDNIEQKSQAAVDAAKENLNSSRMLDHLDGTPPKV
jgi:hypothetical protein